MLKVLLTTAALALAGLPTLAMADVSCVQAQLTEMGFAPGPVDGQLGRRTQNAADALAGQAGLSLPALSNARREHRIQVVELDW
jgi:hypothetical protein